MAVPSHFDREMTRAFDAKMERHLSRIYVLWLLGIVVGVLKLKPTSLSAFGVSFTIENSQLIQGVLFLACGLIYLVIVTQAMLMGLQYAIEGKRILRRAVYIALGARKTVRRFSPKRRFWVRVRARAYLITALLLGLTTFIIPLVHIVGWEWRTVAIAVAQIFFGQDISQSLIIRGISGS